MRKINFVIIACILVSLVFWLSNPDVILEYLAFSGDNLLNGKAWTLITSLFLHADILHLAGNMLFLYIFGNTIEEELGATKTLGAFFIGGIITFPLSLLFYDAATPLIGASAAIFTLAAIVMLIKPLKFSILLFLPQGLVAILYFMYNALAVYSGTEGNVAYIAHIIGFAIGIPFGLAWSKNWLKNLLITIALLIVYIIVVSVLIPAILSAIT
ncbi:rhomboid family intramembrane serine protease [Candidatus Bathyarchaeota archaeon]|nr:rhomboid family intramembrane serine protease [Candidatus Bathyarchaeota archaeon]